MLPTFHFHFCISESTNLSYYHKSKPQHHDLQQSQLAGGGGVEAGDGELHEASDRANLRPSHSNLRLTIGQTCWLINSDQFINQPDAID